MPRIKVPKRSEFPSIPQEKVESSDQDNSDDQLSEESSNHSLQENDYQDIRRGHSVNWHELREKIFEDDGILINVDNDYFGSSFVDMILPPQTPATRLGLPNKTWYTHAQYICNVIF